MCQGRITLIYTFQTTYNKYYYYFWKWSWLKYKFYQHLFSKSSKQFFLFKISGCLKDLHLKTVHYVQKNYTQASQFLTVGHWETKQHLANKTVGFYIDVVSIWHNIFYVHIYTAARVLLPRSTLIYWLSKPFFLFQISRLLKLSGCRLPLVKINLRLLAQTANATHKQTD